MRLTNRMTADPARAEDGATAVGEPTVVPAQPTDPVRSGRWPWLASPWVVLAAWLVTRFFVAAFATDHFGYPGGDVVNSDVRLYSVWSIMLVNGHFPVGDDMWQYPPGAGIVFALPRLLFADPVSGFLVLALAADLAVLAALLLATRRGGWMAGPWAWVVAGVLIGPVFLVRFDVFPTLFAVLAVLLVARPAASGAAAAAGALLKVWPGLMLLALPRRDLLRGGGAFLVTGLGAWIAISLWATGGSSFLTEQGSRGLQIESVGALPYIVAKGLGLDVAFTYQYGAMEVTMAGVRTIGLIVTVAGLAVLGLLLVARLTGRLERVPAGDVALAALLVSIASSRVFSPQYAVWIAGLAAVALLDPRTRMRPVVALLVPMALIAQALYPFGYGSLLGGDALAVLGQTLRIGLLVAATGWAVVAVLRPWPAPIAAPPAPVAGTRAGADRRALLTRGR